jgi:hypothetical protein
MSDVERAIHLAGQLEQALSSRGASGLGLMERARSFETYLPDSVWSALRRISRQRNAIAHGTTKFLDNRGLYERDCEAVLRAIHAIPSYAVAVPCERVGLGLRPGYGSRRAPSYAAAPYGGRDLLRELKKHGVRVQPDGALQQTRDDSGTLTYAQSEPRDSSGPPMSVIVGFVALLIWGSVSFLLHEPERKPAPPVRASLSPRSELPMFHDPVAPVAPAAQKPAAVRHAKPTRKASPAPVAASSPVPSPDVDGETLDALEAAELAKERNIPNDATQKVGNEVSPRRGTRDLRVNDLDDF